MLVSPTRGTEENSTYAGKKITLKGKAEAGLPYRHFAFSQRKTQLELFPERSLQNCSIFSF
eukprot:m.63054 g.63054  ORF g.63054 m.63054 type:complete len:61 (+) comp35133_c0_seq1:292-474(+)